jgi:hypothetical protein
MATKKKCFVISPIGEDNSEIRKDADALLWVTKSALERYDFEVIRVDQIARSTTITNEIIQLIQESELCLIVLTGHNPNVFYEAGRRHETGRPFIQLIRKGEPLPFDLASIRTIIYDDIQSLPSVTKVVEQIQKFADEFEKGGYGASGTGASLSTLASALDRIERKVGQILGGTATVPSASIGFGEGDSGVGFVKNPRESFIAAVAHGDLQRAATLLPRLEQLMGPSSELLATAGILSVQGYEPAAEIVYRLMTEHFDKIHAEGVDGLQAGIASMVQFYVVTDRETEGVARCEPLIRKVASLPQIDTKVKAHVLNQLQMLHYGAKHYEDALGVCEQVLDLNADEPAYIYNASLIYEKLGLAQKAIETVDQYMKMTDIDESHLAHAVEFYTKANRLDDARAAFQQLQQVSPDKAAVLLFRSDIAKKLKH